MKKNRFKKVSIASLIALFFLMDPIISVVSFTPPTPDWTYWLNSDYIHPINLFSGWNATQGYRDRQNITRTNALSNNDPIVQIYLNQTPNEAGMLNDLEKMYKFKDCADFRMVKYIRILYLDNAKAELGPQLLSNDTKHQICDAFGKTKYWYDEPGGGEQIFFTENHQILYHSSEMLVGQLFPNSTFVNSGMTGNEHYIHALPLVLKWLDWKGQYGFSEWHTSTYIPHLTRALMNLVDFANDPVVITKAAMVLDIIAFNIANHIYDGIYATSMGRTYIKDDGGGRYSGTIDNFAWLLLGIGSSSGSESYFSTSDHYAPPPILEVIAANSTSFIEHKERNSIDMDDGPKYGLSYTEEDMMMWWGMSGPIYQETIIETLRIVNDNQIDVETIYGTELLINYLKIAAILKGLTLNQICAILKPLTQGACLESANIYTYRTPNYQLSGAQDHQKGLNSFQKLTWLATLNKSAYVYTNCPGAITKNFNQKWSGGWSPRATFYKNVGIIQYDRESLPLDTEIILLVLRTIFELGSHYLHAYFPTENFEKWSQYDGWTFGKSYDGYIALYSYKPTWWENSYELRSSGLKNGYIVEMGDATKYNTFENFTQSIREAYIQVIPQALGYSITYNSPSQGIIKVAWNGPMQLDGIDVDIGPYPRYDNPYCTQEFATKTTIIEFNNSRLKLDFTNGIRNYTASI